MKFLLAFCLIIFSFQGRAFTGADALLDATGENTESVSSAGTLAATESITTKFKLTDNVLQTLFVEWKSNGPYEFEMNRWFTLVLSQDFTAAAHLWSAVQPHIPESMKATTKITWAYLNWRLDLPQTFISAWREARAAGQESRAWMAFEQVLAHEKSAEWIARHKPYIDPGFSQEIMNSTEGFALELSAWANRHNLQEAHNILARLPLAHPQSLTLATTAVLHHAVNNQLGEAGKLLKRRVEPELQKIGDAKLLSRHYLTLARLLYQSGALEASEAFYSKVPRGLPEFIPARTERTWVLLRLGKIAELRGELESLSHKILADRFLPEVPLVRSISNLKLCRYNDVASDFKFFIESNTRWARTITAALESAEAPAPDMFDPKVEILQQSLKARASEEAKLATLARDSIQAALPAVGEQAHWVNARKDVMTAREANTRELKNQYRRFWKNRELVLAEAIRKMKFVKVEAMVQMRSVADAQRANDTVSSVQAAPGKQTFPFEGVYWPDELFTYQAEAMKNCGVKK